MENIDRSKFLAKTDEYWDAIRDGESKKANTTNRAIQKIVSGWAEQGIAVDALLPLASHASAKVRLGAAAYLIAYPETKQQAVEVLRDLQANDPTLVSTSAGAILRIHQADSTAS
jgi:hypothetical protein